VVLRITEFLVEDVLNVVAVMSTDTRNLSRINEIMPKWEPNLAKSALDIVKIFLRITILNAYRNDIDRFHQPNPGRSVDRSRRGIKSGSAAQSLGVARCQLARRDIQLAKYLEAGPGCLARDQLDAQRVRDRFVISVSTAKRTGLLAPLRGELL